MTSTGRIPTLAMLIPAGLDHAGGENNAGKQVGLGVTLSYNVYLCCTQSTILPFCALSEAGIVATASNSFVSNGYPTASIGFTPC